MEKTKPELFKSANKRISANVKRLAKKKGWTLEKVAVEAELDNGNLYNMVNGKINFTMRTIVRLEEALQTDIVEFFKK